MQGERRVSMDVEKAIAYAVHNETTTSRNTKLAERIASGWKDAVKNAQKDSGSGILYTYEQDVAELPKIAEKKMIYGTRQRLFSTR
ncbi:MAG: hypothetical protein LUH53_06370 [Lachnospiraceae bacterium]|nr:hypothetical protein [Lachnospiraceae bacterium]